MSTWQQKVEALEKVGAGALAEQALQTLMRLHVQTYDRHIVDVQREFAPFEPRYGLRSAACYRRFLAGEMGESADLMEWMGRYEDVLLYQERMATLRAATEG